MQKQQIFQEANGNYSIININYYSDSQNRTNISSTSSEFQPLPEELLKKGRPVYCSYGKILKRSVSLTNFEINEFGATVTAKKSCSLQNICCFPSSNIYQHKDTKTSGSGYISRDVAYCFYPCQEKYACKSRSTTINANISKLHKEENVSAVKKYADDFTAGYVAASFDSPYRADLNVNSSCESLKTEFPFHLTPSGNFKVFSNQVVFQSPTVGILLADPLQAKVKVKFNNTQSEEYVCCANTQCSKMHSKFGESSSRPPQRVDRLRAFPEDGSKELASLGYGLEALTAPDWSRLQLPKKTDLYQEFYRRIHNFENPDMIVHVGEDEFHCHLMVLQVYSTYFDSITSREVELPRVNVTPDSFQTLYDWMIFNGAESSSLLRRQNVLELMNASHYLGIKDLEEQCWAFVDNEELFYEDTAFALFQDARKRGNKAVMELMVPRVMRFFLPLVASRDYLNLSVDEVAIFLRSNYICVTSEIEVLMSAVRWLFAAWPERRQHVDEILGCVRFGLVSPWQLVDAKRNPDNPEIQEVINFPAVNQMVDDGLAYVIIKYWYGNNSKNYYHWIEVLGLTEPAERNWIGEEKNHVTYGDFLQYLEQFQVPKEQAYQHLAMQQQIRTKLDNQASPRKDRDTVWRPPAPPGLSPMAGLLNRSLDSTGSNPPQNIMPTVSEFLQNRKRVTKAGMEESRDYLVRRQLKHDSGNYNLEHMNEKGNTRIINANLKVLPKRHSFGGDHYSQPQRASVSSKTGTKLLAKTSAPQKLEIQKQIEDLKKKLLNLESEESQLETTELDDIEPSRDKGANARKSVPAQTLASVRRTSIGILEESARELEEDSEKESSSEESSSSKSRLKNEIIVPSQSETDLPILSYSRPSVAASYLAAATTSLPTSSKISETTSTSKPPLRSSKELGSSVSSRHGPSPQLSMFNDSKELLAKLNMNKLSASVLGPANKNYMVQNSLFSWERESVLVMGGVDPHSNYGQGRNTGKDIYKFDPVSNVWDCVGELPEPRHHHAMAFLKGRVYLVGGADPRDDDVRGKSVVVSTVWSYEPATRAWYSESGLSTPRKNFGLVAHHAALYAIGGQDKSSRVLRSVERFSSRSGRWRAVRAMSSARMGVACATHRGRVWVAGGMTGERRQPLCSTVECYDERADQWTEINELRFPRCFATLFSMNDQLYLLGGAGMVLDKSRTTSSVGAIDVWDMKERTWSLQTEMSIPRHGHALAYLGTQLIIIGGVTTVYMRALDNVESFCCERMAWIRGVAKLPAPLSGHAAVTLPPASLL